MYARALTKNKDDAEDLVSDAVVACYENFAELRNLSAFRGYMFKTIRSLYRMKHRRAWLFGMFDERKFDEMMSNEPAPDLPADIDILYKALDRLPNSQKEAVVLFEISGFSIKEILDIQGGTISGVKSRIQRGREKLKFLLYDNVSSVNILNDVNSKFEVER